ncbi:SDR family oxidoreductase [Roseococcus suduntuyensis]|uniref:Short-subunit dehydrogenase n=1 Tax=Roseococcus suduntuyensis TaxID=455361 RepID=A0A840A5U4_9PROT|nr:SDR family oxidoreductase [Roseococcus suduntuyensis]MBB3897328.1 short-subunit dehydrogenase [Roseococcus suduntuyensis]
MARKSKPLNQQVIVITGATSGIGLTTACMAARRGAKVVMAARNEEALETVCSAIKAAGGQCTTVVADVGVREDVAKIAEVANTTYGGFDTWVNNAGIGAYAKLEEMSDEDHQKLFQTNYWGVVYGSTEALKTLKKRGGTLINIGSISSEMPSPILSAYTASKFAVKGFTDSLRLEMIHEGSPARITLIQPSGIDTPFGEHAVNYMEEKSQVPPPVYAPEVVAKAILHAAVHPTRDLVVGGWGRFMIALTRTVPLLADQVFSFAFFRTARQAGVPKRDTPKNLHSAGEDGKRYGDQGHTFSNSLYTTAKMYPVTSLALMTLGALGIAALCRGTARETYWDTARRTMNEYGRDAGRYLSSHGHDAGRYLGSHASEAGRYASTHARDAGRYLSDTAADHGLGRQRGWLPRWDNRSWWERGYDNARDAAQRLRNRVGL